MFKYGKKMPSNLEDYQNEINIDDENNKKIQIYDGKNGKALKTTYSNSSSSKGITRIVNVGTTTQEIGNALITTKTTKISYKRRRVEKNQETKENN